MFKGASEPFPARPNSGRLATSFILNADVSSGPPAVPLEYIQKGKRSAAERGYTPRGGLRLKDQQPRLLGVFAGGSTRVKRQHRHRRQSKGYGCRSPGGATADRRVTSAANRRRESVPLLSAHKPAAAGITIMGYPPKNSAFPKGSRLVKRRPHARTEVQYRRAAPPRRKPRSRPRQRERAAPSCWRLMALTAEKEGAENS
jgi:hypothetical protein